MNDSDTKRATQEFAIKSVLIDYCGQHLTPQKIDEIMQKIKDEMTNGPCAWAFNDE